MFCFVKLKEFSPNKFFPEDTQYDIQVRNNDELLIIPITEESEVPNGYSLMTLVERDSIENQYKADWLAHISVTRKIVPDKVTPRQIRQGLILKGVSLAQIDAILDSLPEPQKSLAKVEWEFSTEVQRGNPMVNQVGAVLGWTQDQLDDLFIFGAKL